METIYVIFGSDGETILTACALQQTPALTAITTDDVRWKVYYDPLPLEVKMGWPAPAGES